MPVPRTTVALAPQAPASAAILKKCQHEQAEPSAPMLPTPIEEPAICRLCWGEREGDEPMLSPCNCSGSLKYIHAHCLADWQRTLRAQGQSRRAHLCELCKAPYKLQHLSGRHQSSAGPLRQLHRRLMTAISSSVFDAVYNTPWPSLVVQLWHGYVMTLGVLQAAKSGMTGFGAGLNLGKVLVEDQANLITWVFGCTTRLLGSPYAEILSEMLWCQAVGALFVGMLSELMYTSILGMLGGMAYGFCVGYVGAIKGSARLVAGISRHLVSTTVMMFKRVMQAVLRR